MKKGVYPGSFDPITNGHIDVIRRAARFADELYVAVLINTAKKYMFTTEERVEMLKESVGDIENVRCISYSGLLVDFCREYEIDAIIKGLRVLTDYDMEVQMALMNKRLNEDVETLFLVAGEGFSYVSSSIIKEVARYGGDIGGLVPPHVEKALLEKRR